ncbi:MAG: hypothetical protein K9N01_16080 [Cephaloticoccus sp.]|nr:hypothetical protein [Cephaloticoccus sp.]
MATRSDGRLLNGPTVTRIEANLGTDLLWCLAPDGDKLLIGTGPEGKVLSVTSGKNALATAKVELALPASHVFSVLRLPTGELLVGTSPDGSLVLARDGKVVARAKLPADSILDISLDPAIKGRAPGALIATGNPGRIYRVDLAKFAAGGESSEKLRTSEELAAHGFTLWGSVRDENIRCLLRLTDGRVVAGSAPKGNVYQFADSGGDPLVLAENRNAEVSDLLPWEGGFYAAITFTNEPHENRVKRPIESKAKEADDEKKPETDTATILLSQPPPNPNFRGRSQLLWFPTDGFPEVVATRTNTAFYRLQRQQDLVLITGGEDGDLLGYDPSRRRSLTFAGATASQVNAIVPVMGRPDAYYLLGNNPGSLALLDFASPGLQSAETERIDLSVPSSIGALRFEGPDTLPEAKLQIELRSSFGSDPMEGWSPWQKAVPDQGGWRVPGLRGRYVQARFSTGVVPFELGTAQLYTLPQNRRPQLDNFRILAPNFALIPAPPRAERPGTSLAQIMQGSNKGDNQSRTNFLSSEIVPQTGTQVVFWSVDDPDGDNLVSTFSMQAVGDSRWTELAIATQEKYAQFEISHLPEGVYQTRLVVSESEPRPLDQRLSTTFETDDFLVDRTAPEIISADLKAAPGQLLVTVRARDALSLLRGMEIKFNNGAGYDVEQPIDGVLDGREETFAMTFTAREISGSTAVEVVVLDQAGNSSARRLRLPAP